MLRQSWRRGRAFFGDHTFESREPMMIVSFTGVGITCGVPLFDLLAKHRGPLAPGEQTFFMESQRHSKRVGFPWRAKDRAVVVARYTRDGFGSAPGGFGFDGR